MKRYKVLLHDIFVEIWRTRSRYLSILCIVLLGVGFFAGIKSTCPDMKETAQKYFEDQNLMDMHLKSTMGFTQEDIRRLEELKDVDAVAPAYSADAFVTPEDTDAMLVRALSWKIGSENKKDTINHPLLKEGRWPKAKNECLVEHGMYAGESFQVGKQITLFSEESDLSKQLNTQTFTIVGVVESPLYINFERGNSNLGTGSVRSFLYLPEETFAYEFYTDVFLSYQDTQGLPFYEDAYEERIDQKIPQLEELAATQEQTRHDAIYNEAKSSIDQAQAELDQAQAEYESNKLLFEQQTAQAAQELASAKKKIADSELLLSRQQKQLESGRAQYDAVFAQWQEKSQTLAASAAQLSEKQQQKDALANASAQAKGLMDRYQQTALSPDEPMPADVEKALRAASALDPFVPQSAFSFSQVLREYLYADPMGSEKATFAAQLSGVLQGIDKELAANQKQLESAKKALEEGRRQLNDYRAQLDAQAATLATGEAKLKNGWAQLAVAKEQYSSGMSQLNSEKAQGQQKLEEALAAIEEGRAELLDARHDLNDLGSPEWYLLDRSTNPGYSEFAQDAERVDRVAAVFPVFFILVAALVCLTTMTRMVEEQRTQMGTLKALGYGKGSIIAKYLFYALSATLIGSVLGLLVGFEVFPTLIFNAYRIMYILPECLTPFRWDYALLCTLTALACTGFAALAACYHALEESPAQLMRPRAPRAGKRALLEKIPFFWRRLSFLQKVTARNLFRYKKRVFLTVVGIAGCTALMVAGFGLQHAIASIVDLQYEEIFHYDALTLFDNHLTADEQQEIIQQLHDSDGIEQFLAVQQTTADISHHGSAKNLYLFVPQDPEALRDYITLRTRGESDPLSLPASGAVLTEKMARMLDVEVGDTVDIDQGDNHPRSVEVVGITENYTFNFLYLSPSQYESLWGKASVPNAFLLNLGEKADQDDLASSLLENNNILSVSYTENSGSQFRDVVGSLGYIVLVLIICAGALAFVVLYNLANINVEERIREIATIKVLGFYDKEVSAYIYRESILSSLLGMGVGLLLGIPFLRFIIHTAEVDTVMFNPSLSLPTFLLSALLTVFFTLIVNAAMHFRLKRVDMVQSLKSIE